MSDLDNDLRSLSDDVTADATRLLSIETEKVDLQPGSERIADLSHEAEGISRALASKTRAQRELAQQLSRDS